MKILQVVQKPQRRGAEIFARQLSERLRVVGHEVRTAYLYPHAGDNSLPLHASDEILDGREHHCFERIPGIHPSLLRRLKRLIARWQPDIVQVNGGRTLKYGAAAATGSQPHRWALIYRSIGQPQRWFRGSFHRGVYSSLVLPRVHGVVSVSSSTLETLNELYDLAMPTARIPCAVDPDSLAPSSPRAVIRREADTPQEARVVLYVGSLSAEKRVDRLLRVVKTARRTIPNLHLWIVGEGPLRSALEAQVKASSLEPCVRFIGVQNEVSNYMRAADLVALTSDTEGMPAVVLEAGLLERAVVTTRVGGLSECILDGTTGLLVERNDEIGFAQSIVQLFQQPDRLHTLGTTARQWIEDNFVIAQIAEQYEAFYRHVLCGHALRSN